jgi:mannose/cellobiose epimerase-like protein (N-acyl-D-glucosamine 2-epimerase family)
MRRCPVSFFEPLERRQLLSEVPVDPTSVRNDLVQFVDLWNGGTSGRSGTAGMGTYSTTWDGLFRTNLDRQFNRVHYYTDDQTIISQSRAIYINVEAYRNASAADRSRFGAAAQKGADYLLSHAVDPKTYGGKPGGLWWGLQSDGVSPPTHTTQIFGTLPRSKDAYGQVQAIFALAQAYSVTHDVDHLNGAFAQLNVWNTQFADSAAGAGAFLATASEDYSKRLDTRNLDYMTHALEALLVLNEATPASDPRRIQLAAQITNIGNFITTRMYRDAAGSTTMGYLPWYYDAQWKPSADPQQQFMTPGHNLEVAFLLSRAVEQGFSANWLSVANKLVSFALKYGYDNSPTSPTYGAVRYERLKFDGTPFGTTPQDLVWWQTSEAARTLVNFAVVRGRSDLWDEFDASTAFINNHFIDSTYGGWFTALNPSTLAPTTTNKGTVWTVGYHETMFAAEELRLFASQPYAGAPLAIASTGTTTIQAENFDVGRDGIAFHDADVVNSGGAYRATGVDIQSTTDSGGGYNVGWTRAGEWLGYTVDVAAAGTYDFEFRVAAATVGGKFHVEVDGKDATGILTVPNTGGWQSWQSVKRSGVALPAGVHLLKLAMDTAAANGSIANFNYFKLSRTAMPQTTIKSDTATYVRDGPFAAVNYGTNPTLEVKKSTSGYTRETYIKFDLSSVATIASAKLRLFGKLSDSAAAAMTIGIYGVSATAWTEAGLTWNGRPSTGSSALANFSVTGTTAKWYEVDVTNYLRAEKLAGRNVVAIALKSQVATTTVCAFDSDEITTGPQVTIQS